MGTSFPLHNNSLPSINNKRGIDNIEVAQHLREMKLEVGCTTRFTYNYPCLNGLIDCT